MKYQDGAFLGLPKEFTTKESKYAILPVPYEGTVCFKKGTAKAPQAIIDVSPQMEWFDDELRQECYTCGIETKPAVKAARSPEKQIANVKKAVDGIVANEQFPIMIGGEHSITLGAVQALSEVYPDLTILQIDAHADLRDEFDGSKYSHACVMRRCLEHTPNLVQVGIRSFSLEESQQCPIQIANLFTPHIMRYLPNWIDSVVQKIKGPVYISIDMDGLDPSIAPGVGTPEPDGLTWVQVTSLLRNVFNNHQVVGADIVETIPNQGANVTEFIAAKLAYKIICYNESADN